MKLTRGGRIAFGTASLASLGIGLWFVARGPSSKPAQEAPLTRARRPALELARPSSSAGTIEHHGGEPRAAPPRAELLAKRLLELWREPSGDDDEASRIAAELLSLGEGAATPLLDALVREPSGSPRDRSFDLLRQVPGSAAESGLIAEALSTDAGVSRVIAIEALGQRGTERALQTLNQVARTDPQVLAQPFITTTVPDSNDTSTEVPDEVVFTPRMKAMAALAASGNARAIPMLVAVLREEPDQALRMEAASALRSLSSDASAVEALIAAALTDRSPYVRLAALHSLTGVIDPGLFEPLGRISLGDSHPGVRLLAVRILAQLRADLRSAELGG
jgi:HEAT repeat protein